MKKDESIQLMYASLYVQASKPWTMEKVINAFEIIGCKHKMALDQQNQLISNAISTFDHNLNKNASQQEKMRVFN